MKKKDNNDLLPISDDEFVQRKPKRTFKNAILKVANTALVLVISAEVGLMGRWTFVYSNNYIKNEDIIPEASESLSADISILERDTLNDSIVKLKPNMNNKVYVYIDDNVPERARKNIEESLEYFNEIFADINTKYHFEVCDKATYLANLIIKNSVINFEYKELDSLTYGDACSTPNRPALLELINKDWYYSNMYFTGNTIRLNSLYFDNLRDITQKSVINHEMLHTLGIDDTYEGYFEEASLMNANMASFTNLLSPKDLSRLHILYDEKLIGENNTINEKEMARVKEIIADYEKEYYQEIINVLTKEWTNRPQPISDEELIGFKSKSENFDFDLYISIDKNGIFSYQTADGLSGSRAIIKGENFVILPNIKVKENYEDYLVILKENGKLNAYNLCIIGGISNDLVPIENKSLWPIK